MLKDLLPDQAGDEAGMTLVELVAVLAIFSIALFGIFGALDSLTASEARAQRRVAAQEATREAVVALSRDLRSSKTIDQAASPASATQSISFYRSDGKHTRWRVDTTQKKLYRELDVSTTTTPSWSVAGTYDDITTTTDGLPFLSYFGAANLELNPATTLATDLARCTVRLRLTVRSFRQGATRNYTVASDVLLRNRGSRGVAGC
ncbi:MAG TPA: prepilin-type N-terminal cleavage/methylation domain-containing protein [Acidimicrobiales bacterium]|nr:prepilin-type N-terminal cleavage/methylation domain-containing protein [Acidimicrobiales bacterium]